MTKEVKESFLCVHSLRAQSSLLGSHYYRSMKHLKQANSEKKNIIFWLLSAFYSAQGATPWNSVTYHLYVFSF